MLNAEKYKDEIIKTDGFLLCKMGQKLCLVLQQIAESAIFQI